MNPRKALLIIDMQKGSFTERTPRHDTTGVIERINGMAQQFRAINEPVIFIQHDGTKQNNFLPHSIDWEILSELLVDPTDIIIPKTANDAFYETELDSRLKALEIEELVISGCATDFCVNSTIQSALTKDYKVTVVEDMHTTGNRPHLNAEQIIAYHNYIWKEMIPTKGSITVKSYASFLRP